MSQNLEEQIKATEVESIPTQLGLFDQLLKREDYLAADLVARNNLLDDKEQNTVKVTYEDFDYNSLNIYAGIDCIATSELLIKQFPHIVSQEPIRIYDTKNSLIPSKAPSIIDSFLNIEIPAQEFLIDMEINGMLYSPPRNEWIARKMMVQVEELEDKIFKGIGKKIDLNSAKKVAEFLHVEKGFKIDSKTKTGEAATDGQALMKLAGLDPLGGKYITEDPSIQWIADMALRKDIFSTFNTFIKSYVRDFVKRDGRIHPSYNQFGTSSFRITGSDPNLTQLPRSKHGYNVRVCYIVSDGHVFISFDFSSAEVKVLANISKEPAMLKAIADGLDFHSFSASMMLGIPYDEFVAVLADKKNPLFKTYKEHRQIAKILTFSLLYGSSDAGIAGQLFMELSKAKELISVYFKKFPKVKNYIEGTHKFALQNEMSLTPLGQRRRQYGLKPCFKPTAAYNAALRGSQNMVIQSTTSTIGLATFAELNERIKPLGAKSICTVYDSIEIECPIEKAAQVIEIGYDTLNNYPLETFDFLELPIGCEGDVGISWGETEVIHQGTEQEKILRIIDDLKQKSIASFGKWIY